MGEAQMEKSQVSGDASFYIKEDTGGFGGAPRPSQHPHHTSGTYPSPVYIKATVL